MSAIRLRLVTCTAALAMLAATAAGVRAAPPTVEEMFGKPDYLGATLSPSGRYLAVIAPVDGEPRRRHHGRDQSQRR